MTLVDSAGVGAVLTEGSGLAGGLPARSDFADSTFSFTVVTWKRPLRDVVVAFFLAAAALGAGSVGLTNVLELSTSSFVVSPFSFWTGFSMGGVASLKTVTEKRPFLVCTLEITCFSCAVA